MPCPTCRHTVQHLGLESERTFWCPRCGTVMTYVGDRVTSSAPFVVARIRSAEDLTIYTTVDHQTVAMAVPARMWADICEAVGVPVHPFPGIEIGG